VPYPVRIWANPSRHCRAMMLSSSRRTGDSHADSSLGGGSPAYTVATGGVLGVGAPLDAIPTAVEDCPSRLPIASFPWSVFTVASSQNEFLLSCRSRRKKHRRKWCTIARVWVLSSQRPWRPGGSVRPDWAEVEGKVLSYWILDGRPRLEREIPLRLI
jgi:hypothetical protein